MSKPTAQVLKGDCAKLLRSAEHIGKYRLVVCDPPYAFGQKYDEFVDTQTETEYQAFTAGYLDAVAQAMTPDGSLWVIVPEEWLADVEIYARANGLHRRRHIAWAFTFGQAGRRNFTRSHVYLIYFVKDRKTFVFNEDVVRVPSARSLVYADKRANPKGKLPDATWMLLADQMKPYCGADASVWLESRVCGTFKARNKQSPNQIPLPIYRRIVQSTSAAGDRVLDPFAGTFGLGEVCKELDRGYVGIDVSDVCCKMGRERLGLT